MQFWMNWLPSCNGEVRRRRAGTAKMHTYQQEHYANAITGATP
jgi:hypothetical protein